MKIINLMDRFPFLWKLLVKMPNYIEYEGNIRGDFFEDIDLPHPSSTDKCFIGELEGDRFWFCKTHPMQYTGFTIVLYGEILDDHMIRFGYGTRKDVYNFFLRIDATAFFIFFLYFLYGFLVCGLFLPSR